MVKIYERLLSTNILREKKRHSFDPQRVTLLGEDSICMVNLLETPRVIVFFFKYVIDLLWLFQKRSFVLSSEHENKISPLSVHCKINHVKLKIRTSCSLFRVSPRYLIELRQKA